MATVEFVLSNLPFVLTLLGAGLIIMEAFAPGAHFFVVGVALFAAGLVGLVLPPALGPLNLLIMTAVVILSAGATLWAYWEFDIQTGGGKDRTTDSESLRGQIGRVTERVTPREGQVKLEDGGFNPYYQARSIDGEIPVGEEVFVIDPGGGNVLKVESVGDAKDDIDRELERSRREAQDSERESEDIVREPDDLERETESESSV